MKKQTVFIVLLVIVLLAAVAAAVFFALKTQKQDADMQALTEMMDLEKERLETEYENYTLEFEDVAPKITNDSLIKLVDEQKVKIQQLLYELKVTKSTNARRIQELKDELASVRKVMVYYVNQIDSLNTQNQILTQENQTVRQQYRQATQTVEQLSKEKENLTEVVTRASIIEMSGFVFAALDKRGKKTTKLSKTTDFQFNYTITKNITAAPGNKMLYLRIARPDNIVLTKNAVANIFPFENQQITYSAKKEFEYANEEVSGTVFYKIDELLPAGVYRAEFFLEGYRIGSYQFEIEK